jgi:ABC-type transporter Mla subunit MlaD
VSGARRGRDRAHLAPGRRRRPFLRLAEDEYADIVSAARSAGLTPTGYAAEAALATARGGAAPLQEPWREVLAELMAARAQVRRFGNNVNQAVRHLNSTGEAPEALARALEATTAVVQQLDRVAAQVAGSSR